MILVFWHAIQQALDLYCMLQERGVTYRLAAVTVYDQPEPPSMTMVIRASTHDDVTISHAERGAGEWRLPGSYAHRRGRR